MPRRARLVLPGIPLHITQRGVNRAATFLDGEDFARYRQLLAQVLGASELPVHAHSLMSNHVHLLIKPNSADELARRPHRDPRAYPAGTCARQCPIPGDGRADSE